MNQPQRWRGSPSSPLGAVIFVGMLLALLLTTSGCVHIAVLSAMTNAVQMHQINKIEKRLTAIEVDSGRSNRAVRR